MNGIKDKIIDRYLNQINQINELDIKNELLSKYTLKINKYLSSKDSLYHNISSDNSTIIIGENLSHEKKIVYFFPVFINGNNIPLNIEDIIDECKKKFNNTPNEIAIELFGDQLDIKYGLESLGFRAYSTMIGETKILKNYITNRSDYNFKEVDFDHDIDFILEFEKNAQMSNPENIDSFNLELFTSMLRNHFKRMCKMQTAFFLKDSSEKIVGLVGIVIPEKGNLPFISCVSIDPQFQGKGLSIILYSKIYEILSLKNYKYYSSVTTNRKVLNISKKLERIIPHYVMVKSLNRIDGG